MKKIILSRRGVRYLTVAPVASTEGPFVSINNDYYTLDRVSELIGVLVNARDEAVELAKPKPPKIEVGDIVTCERENMVGVVATEHNADAVSVRALCGEFKGACLYYGKSRLVVIGKATPTTDTSA